MMLSLRTAAICAGALLMAAGCADSPAGNALFEVETHDSGLVPTQFLVR